MEKIRVLGIDPALRNTGIGIVEYNTEDQTYKVHSCQVITNPMKYKATAAILNMLDLLMEVAEKPCYSEVDAICIESPAILFNKNFSGGALIGLAHITGGCAVAFDLQKTFLFRPNEWNKTRKKEITHRKTVGILGDPDSWGYAKRVTTATGMEHILDAVSMALFYIQNETED